MMSKEKYLANAERVLKAAGKRREAFYGECQDCRWSAREGVFRLYDECRNPVVKMAALAVERPYDAERVIRCREQRDRKSYYGEVVCGPDGILFEPKQSLFLRISQWLQGEDL